MKRKDVSREYVKPSPGAGASMRFDEVSDPVDLDILDWGQAANILLAVRDAEFVSVEGNAVPGLCRQFSGLRVKRRVGKAGIGFSLRPEVATFRKSPELVSTLLPLLTRCDWSIFHLNLHDAGTRVVQAYDWGEGCCPVSVASRLRDVVASLVESDVARPWPEDDTDEE